MEAVELHLNATYAQDLALKSVYEENQYIMSGKLFSSKTFSETMPKFHGAVRILPN